MNENGETFLSSSTFLNDTMNIIVANWLISKKKILVEILCGNHLMLFSSRKIDFVKCEHFLVYLQCHLKYTLVAVTC